MRRITEQSLTNAALFYLQRYSATERRLKTVLTRKIRRAAQRLDSARVPSEKEVKLLLELVVVKLKRLGFVDDARLAEHSAEVLARGGKSRRSIALKLRQKGVATAEVEQALSKVSANDEDAVWTFARKKRLGPFRAADRQAHREKDLARLVRGGFSFSLARAVIDAPRPD